MNTKYVTHHCQSRTYEILILQQGTPAPLVQSKSNLDHTDYCKYIDMLYRPIIYFKMTDIFGSCDAKLQDR